MENALPDEKAKAQADAAGQNICAYRTGEGDLTTTPVAAYQFGPGGFASHEAFYEAHDSGERLENVGEAAIYEKTSDPANEGGSRAGGEITVLVDEGQTFTLAVYNAFADRKSLVDAAKAVIERL